MTTVYYKCADGGVDDGDDDNDEDEDCFFSPFSYLRASSCRTGHAIFACLACPRRHSRVAELTVARSLGSAAVVARRVPAGFAHVLLRRIILALARRFPALRTARVQFSTLACFAHLLLLADMPLADRYAECLRG